MKIYNIFIAPLLVGLSVPLAGYCIEDLQIHPTYVVGYVALISYIIGLIKL